MGGWRGVIIRPFRLGDYAAIMAIWRATGFEQEEADLDALARQLAWDSELVLVAEVDGQVVGVIVGTIDGNRAYFYRLAVHPDYQRRGIGRRLVQALEERFREKGVTQIVIMVKQDNEQAIPFYESLGYEVQQLVTLSKRIEQQLGEARS
jgi:Predicted acetyltransferase